MGNKLETIAQELEALAERLRKLGATGELLVQVPYRSQWDADAGLVRGDCGPACVAMMLDWHGTHVAIDDVSCECGMSAQKRVTTAADLIGAAGGHGLTLSRRNGMEADDFLAETRSGRPVICLVHYGSIPDRQDRNYTTGHWMVVIGVDAEAVIVHDPNWWGGRRDEGLARRIPKWIFEQALRDCGLDGNSVGLGLVCE